MADCGGRWVSAEGVQPSGRVGEGACVAPLLLSLRRWRTGPISFPSFPNPSPRQEAAAGAWPLRSLLCFQEEAENGVGVGGPCCAGLRPPGQPPLPRAEPHSLPFPVQQSSVGRMLSPPAAVCLRPSVLPHKDTWDQAVYKEQSCMELGSPRSRRPQVQRLVRLSLCSQDGAWKNPGPHTAGARRREPAPIRPSRAAPNLFEVGFGFGRVGWEVP